MKQKNPIRGILYWRSGMIRSFFVPKTCPRFLITPQHDLLIPSRDIWCVWNPPVKASSYLLVN